MTRSTPAAGKSSYLASTTHSARRSVTDFISVAAVISNPFFRRSEQRLAARGTYRWTEAIEQAHARALHTLEAQTLFGIG